MTKIREELKNRLPFTVEEKNGKLKFEKISGGLVKVLSDYLNISLENLWIDWFGMAVNKNYQKG